VPVTDVTTLDPIVTTAGISKIHGYYVYDTLFGADSQFRIRPQMAEGYDVAPDGRIWTIKLRAGLRFHDGEPVRATDVAASIVRWAQRDGFARLMTDNVDTYRIMSDDTLRLELKKPFPHMLDALGTSSPCFIMPERHAKTDAFTAVKEIIGSGPFRFLADERVVGSHVAYRRFDGYVPRPEPADRFAGGKRPFFERVEWTIMPDPSTAVSALIAGEVDWFDEVPADSLKLLSGRRSIQTQPVDRYGYYSLLRFNCLIPPFDNAALRRAVLMAVDQQDFMNVVTDSDPQRYRTCRSMLFCGMPDVTEWGGERMPGSLDAARAAIQASGYKGQKIVLLRSSDNPVLSAFSDLAGDLFMRLGLNVDVQWMDLGTSMQRRNSKEPVEHGGWNVFATYGNALANPVLNIFTRALGLAGWFGWYKNDKVEALVQEWLEMRDMNEQKALYSRLQQELFDDPPNVPLGQFYSQTAFRSDITGVDPMGGSNKPWTVRRIS
jgi:peptide/nickel transport system substrate-binding protein